MGISRFTASAGLVFVALLALAATGPVHAQAQNAGRNLNLASVDFTTANVLTLNFPAPPGSPSDTIANTDQKNYVRPDALAFLTNVSTHQLDLLIADNHLGTISRYPGALTVQNPPNPTSATLVWNAATQGSGPVAPAAMATDELGNLIVVNSTSGHSQAGQVWIFAPASPTASALCPSPPASGPFGPGYFCAPLLLDSNFANQEALLEVAFAPTDVSGACSTTVPAVCVAGGDLVLLTSSQILVYPRAQNFSAAKRFTLLSFANGQPVPGGMDFWPVGGNGANYSLLVSSAAGTAGAITSPGTISRFYFTNPLTPAPAFTSGLGTLYRLKTLFQAGSPLLFVSQGGAVLEFAWNSASGSGTQVASLTQNIGTPQGFAVSNDFTNAASLCLQPGGCNLTGLLDHTVSSNITKLTGNIVENVCTVNADPRVAIVGGVWSCSVPYTPPASLNFTCPAGTPANGPGCLPVNAVCPGFDDTGKMALPDTLCGRSGKSGAGFSLIKTIMNDTQFAGGLIENALVLADGSNPECGPGTLADPLARDGTILWSPLQAEGTIQEGGNMVDMTDGCGSGHSSGGYISVFGVGVSVNEAAPELNPAGGLPRPLENFAQTKYQNLTSTITNLTNDGFQNISPGVSAALWGGNVPPSSSNKPGCVDQSWLDFYNATARDTDGSPQWIADLQNAANKLTDADAASTCDGITAANPGGFSQTPNATYPNAPTHLNPYGEVRGRLANLYYSIDVRLLGNAAPGHWPLPVSVNVLPTTVTAGTSATLSVNTHGDSGCTLSSSDGQYTSLALSPPQQLTVSVPARDGGTIVAYSVTCSGTVANNAANSVTAYVTVRPPPTVSVTPQAVELGSPATVSWNPNGATGCTGGSNDPSATGFNGLGLSAPGSTGVKPSAAGTFTYTMACQVPSTSVAATLTVVGPPSLSVSPVSATVGTGGTLKWNENGNSNCSLTSSDDTGFTAPSPLPASSSQLVNPVPGTYHYTLACNTPGPTSMTVAFTSVPLPPTISVMPTVINLGNPNGATLTWQLNAGDACTASTSPAGVDTNAADAFSGVLMGSKSLTLQPVVSTAVNLPVNLTYAISCTNPPGAQVSTVLTVNPPLPTASLSISSTYQTLKVNDQANLNWTVSGAKSCTLSNTQWPSKTTQQFPDFSFTTNGSGAQLLYFAASGTYAYQLTCSNSVSQSTTATTSVYIYPPQK